jgi:SAM-dependent MidA family methyltransferase
LNALRRTIVDLINASGPIPVSTFMALCLYDPKHGYYMTRTPLGADGDFTTAPEISQMFGELVGVWLIEMWRRSGYVETPIFAEIGPGRGTLAKDMLRTIARLEPTLSENLDFFLIETSPQLTEVQAQTIGAKAKWLTSISQLPASRPLFIVGNELLDAIPARQLVRTEAGWRERCVGLDADGELAFVASSLLIEATDLPDAEKDAIFEISPAREALIEEISKRIAAHGGAGIFVDYGHLKSAIGDTFQAMQNHAFVDPLAAPGEADLTSHVDFAVLAETARQAGLQASLATQGDFLLSLGLLERAGQLGANRTPLEQEGIRKDVERLAAGDQMGNLFKVLALGPHDLIFPGFAAPI